jgi:hypothetical protein
VAKLHDLAAVATKEAALYTHRPDQTSVNPKAGLGHSGEDKISRFYLGRPAHILLTIPTELSRLENNRRCFALERVKKMRVMDYCEYRVR